MELVLASASPRRRELMNLLEREFTVRPVDVAEAAPENLSGRETAEFISALKAAKALQDASDKELIITSDTLVCLGSSVLGKPRTDDEAFAMLKVLSGKTHRVYTGVTLSCGEKQISFSERTDVTFFALTDEEIRSYIATGEPFDKAGAYGIQGKGALLVERINGDYNNVVGLPVSRLKRELSAFEAGL